MVSSLSRILNPFLGVFLCYNLISLVQRSFNSSRSSSLTASIFLISLLVSLSDDSDALVPQILFFDRQDYDILRELSLGTAHGLFLHLRLLVLPGVSLSQISDAFIFHGSVILDLNRLSLEIYFLPDGFCLWIITYISCFLVPQINRLLLAFLPSFGYSRASFG